MPILTIEFIIFMRPLFGITRWRDSDYETPLKLKIEDCDVEIFLKKPSIFFKKKFAQNEQMKYNLIFKNPTQNLINGIKSLNEKDESFAAEKIYETYKKSHLIMESFLRSVGKIENLFSMSPKAPEDLFGKSITETVYYRFDSNEKIIFSPKLKKPKGISPLFSAKQLLTFEKWKKIQEALNNNDFIAPEIDELLKLKAKLIFNDTRRFAILESMILIEYGLSKYVEKHLIAIGWTNKKIKESKKEITLNLMLNILLPSTLTKAKLKKMRKHISNINALRKIRNEIMHENLKEVQIDLATAKKGIDSSIKLIKFFLQS